MNSEITKTLAIAGGVLSIVFLTVIGTLMVQRIEAAPMPTQIPLASSASSSNIISTASSAITTASQPLLANEPQVISVRPHYITQVIPYRTCHDELETVYVQPGDNFPGAGAMVGGAAGAVIGHTMGHGRGRIAGTVAGALIGALSGNAIQSSIDQPVPETIETTVCHTHYIKKTIQHGYEVTYALNGREVTKIMPVPPA